MTEEFRKIIKEWKNKKILVIGDIMLDQYTFGTVSRISPEAPVPILKKDRVMFVPGGAGNVAHNLASLGAKVALAGTIGKDEKGRILLKLFKSQKIQTAKIMLVGKPTTVKERIVAENNQLLRIDEEETTKLTKSEEEKFWRVLKGEIKKCDIIVLSDYDKGLFSATLAGQIIQEAKEENKKVIADFKPLNQRYFIGADVVTPNLPEAREMTGLRDIKKIGQKLAEDLEASVVVTLGAEGMSIFQTGDDNGTHIQATKIKVFDVSGAGDTVAAVLALGLSSGFDLVESARLANYAAGIVVQKPGTATLSLEELSGFWGPQKHTDEVDVVKKVWGYEKWLENNNEYCCKLLFLKKGYQGSLHYHKFKDETFLVTSGHVKMELGKETIHLREGNFVKIAPGAIHRFTGVEDSMIIESSTHHDEADVFRKEKSKKIN